MRLHGVAAAHGFTQETHNGDDGQFSKSLEVGEVCTPGPGQRQHFGGIRGALWNELNFGPCRRTQTEGRGLKRSVGLDNNTSFYFFFHDVKQPPFLV